MKNFILKQIIGEGATCTVYRALSTDNKEVAIKIIQKTKKNTMLAYKEIEMLSSVNHENILKIYNQMESKKYIYIVSELCEFNLVSFLNEYEVDEIIALKILRMVLCGIKHVHDKGLIHRDIKLGNILIKGNTAKICDFGLSCYAYNNNNTFCGTIDYIAPEIAKKEDYSTSVDMWSIGAVFYVLLTKKKFSVSQETPNCSKEALDLLYKLLEKKPNKRITANEALIHPCFKNFIPKCSDYRLIANFEKATKYGILKKEENTVKLNDITIECVVKTDEIVTSFKNLLHLKNSNDPALLHENNCICDTDFSYIVKINNKKEKIEYLTNSQLKTISFISAYLKMIKNKTSKIVIEEGCGKFYYTLSGNFAYVTNSYTLKKTESDYEITEIKDGQTQKLKYKEIPEDLNKIILNLYEKCKKTDKMTCWTQSKIPMLINTSSHYPLSISYISQVSEISLKNKNLYKFKKDLGWCIKTNLNFLFLLNTGEKLEILAKDTAIIYEERRFQINNSLPPHIKNLVKKVRNFIEAFI